MERMKSINLTVKENELQTVEAFRELLNARPISPKLRYQICDRHEIDRSRTVHTGFASSP